MKKSLDVRLKMEYNKNKDSPGLCTEISEEGFFLTNILFAASECVPFVKTGGLADVCGALPKEILKAGEDIRVILPLYKAIGQ